jgi:electron transport complex protein RnfD/electron transport complex protein RnfC
MWWGLAFLSALLLGCYDSSKKISLEGNAVIPVLFLNTVLSAVIFFPFVLTEEFGGWEIQKYILAKSALVLSSWLAGYYAMKHLPLTLVGPINATRPVLVLIGAIFLVATGVIDLTIPFAYIGAFLVFIILFGGHLTTGDLGYFILAELCGGGLMLGAFFMATDYVTSPITPRGKLIYGLIAGVLLGVFRMFGSMAEGCSYSIIFANLLVPLIERWTIPKAFGKGGE